MVVYLQRFDFDTNDYCADIMTEYKDFAVWLIPVMLGVIAYIVQLGIKHVEESIKKQADKQDQFNESISELNMAIKLLARESSSRCELHEERFGRIYGSIATLDNTIEKHADLLQSHEIRLTKLEQYEE